MIGGLSRGEIHRGVEHSAEQAKANVLEPNACRILARGTKAPTLSASRTRKERTNRKGDIKNRSRIKWHHSCATRTPPQAMEIEHDSIGRHGSQDNRFPNSETLKMSRHTGLVLGTLQKHMPQLSIHADVWCVYIVERLAGSVRVSSAIEPTSYETTPSPLTAVTSERHLVVQRDKKTTKLKLSHLHHDKTTRKVMQRNPAFHNM